MKIISPMQCRAARAILNLTRSDLAELSSLSAAAIGGFETEATEPRSASINLMRIALEAAGVEFLDDDGVRMKRNQIRVYEGAAIHRQLLDEIYNDMKEKGGEILIRGLTEKKWESGDDESFLSNHLARLQQAGITERILLSDQDNVFVAPKHWYRQVPEKYFSSHTQWLFNSKVAMVEWGDVETLTIIENRLLFDAESKIFNCVWDNVAKVVE